MPRTTPTASAAMSAATSATASASWARNNFAEVLGRVAYGKERITIERRGADLSASKNPAAGLEWAEPIEKVRLNGDRPWRSKRSFPSKTPSR